MNADNRALALAGTWHAAISTLLSAHPCGMCSTAGRNETDLSRFRDDWRMGDPHKVVHELVGAVDYPMYIVTVAAAGERAGCLVGFTTQCSIDPPRFLVCLSDKNRTFRVARRAELLVVHLVPDTAEELARLFGSDTGDDVDKFEQCEWTPGPGGAPVLSVCRNWFAGRVLERWPAGDHWAYLLDPVQARSEPGERPFEFHRAKRLEPGHEA